MKGNDTFRKRRRQNKESDNESADTSYSTSSKDKESTDKCIIDNKQFGSFNSESNEWEWNFTRDLRLRVGRFRGKSFVDIRHMWQGHPTKKGVFLSVEAFKAIQSWPCLDEALSKLKM